jgi:hypothetical protein
MRYAALLFGLALGCSKTVYPPTGGGPPVPGGSSTGGSTPGGSDLAAAGDLASGDPFPSGSGHARPSVGAQVFHVAANDAPGLPSGANAYAIVANGLGGYTLSWSASSGSSPRFHGSLFTSGSFDQVGTSGTSYVHSLEQQSRLDFDSNGSRVGSIDLISSADPVVVDLLVNGQYAGFTIGFIDSKTGHSATTGGIDPAGFASP